jgi:hypothetical protein
MNTRELEIALAAADPVGRERLDRLDLAAMEAELLADLDGERPARAPGARAARPRRRRRLALALGTAALAAIVAVIAILAGGTSEQPARAYGAELVRFAESSPLLLLEGPGWRVQNVWEHEGPGGVEGSMEFVTGRPIPFESIDVTGNDETGQHESGMAPAAVRQRKVELDWRHGSLAETVTGAHHRLHSHGQRWARLPVLGTTADVDTRDEVFVNQGGPGDRQMTAYWSEGGYVLELRAAVPDLAGFEERLGWLQQVDTETWLDAMPAQVVKAADHDATVRTMLKGIPLPSTFKPSLIPDAGLTTNRDQVAASVGNTVSCLWFLQWGEARRSGDQAKKLEAERAMATSPHWPILRHQAQEGAIPLIWELAAAMPGGILERGPHRWRLLPHAEALGCAREGLPLLPWKQRRQRERQEGAPPR